MIASAAGHAECLYLLLGAGAVVGHADRWGRTALHLAAQNAHVSLVQMLLQAGADPFIEDCKGGVRAAFSAPTTCCRSRLLGGGPDLLKAMIQDCYAIPCAIPCTCLLCTLAQWNCCLT